jgi:NAD(P)-dependent dehydrogenase (short-subunit alcohol dehydrogenase family)
LKKVNLMNVNLLKGKRIAITGGSSGIGEELVGQASAAGAIVVFSYNSGLDRAKRIAERTGAEAIHFVLGGDDSEFIYGLETLSGYGGGIHYFIANAGKELSGGLKKHTREEIDRILRINLNGNMHLLRELIDGDLMAQGGQMAVIGSIAAQGNHDQFAYSAAKAGLRGAVGVLQYDAQVREGGLGVKLIEPAFVRTPQTERPLRLVERIVKRKGGDALWDEFVGNKYVVDADYAAREILEMTVNPEIIGRRGMPEGFDLREVREKYF